MVVLISIETTELIGHLKNKRIKQSFVEIFGQETNHSLSLKQLQSRISFLKTKKNWNLLLTVTPQETISYGHTMEESQMISKQDLLDI